MRLTIRTDTTSSRSGCDPAPAFPGESCCFALLDLDADGVARLLARRDAFHAQLAMTPDLLELVFDGYAEFFDEMPDVVDEAMEENDGDLAVFPDDAMLALDGPPLRIECNRLIITPTHFYVSSYLRGDDNPIESCWISYDVLTAAHGGKKKAG